MSPITARVMVEAFWKIQRVLLLLPGYRSVAAHSDLCSGRILLHLSPARKSAYRNDLWWTCMTQVKKAQKENPGTTLEVNYCVPRGLLSRLCERDWGVSLHRNWGWRIPHGECSPFHQNKRLQNHPELNGSIYFVLTSHMGGSTRLGRYTSHVSFK